MNYNYLGVKVRTIFGIFVIAFVVWLFFSLQLGANLQCTNWQCTNGVLVKVVKDSTCSCLCNPGWAGHDCSVWTGHRTKQLGDKKIGAALGVDFSVHGYLEDEQDQCRFVILFGTRPEIIKMAPVMNAFAKAGLEFKSVFTGQHPDMIDKYRKWWKIRVDTHIKRQRRLAVFQEGQSLPQLIGALITEIENLVPEKDNDIWIVQGDTTTSLAAGLVAFLRGTPIIHLEAGLRTFDHAAPFPEELNRRALSLMASIHIAPTELAKQHLLAQGVEKDRIFVYGNTGIDAARLAEAAIQFNYAHDGESAMPPALEGIDTRLILMTLHRRENIDFMPAVYAAVASASLEDITVVVPVHPNPASGKAATDACARWSIFKCIDILGYGETQWILQKSLLILTDSGGLQEEATWYGKPVLVLREKTERSEAIDAGVSILALDRNFNHTLPNLLTELSGPGSKMYKNMAVKVHPFGDGFTAERLVNLLKTKSSRALFERPIRMVSDSQTKSRYLPLCSDMRPWVECDKADTDVDVFLTVYKRSSLESQLRNIAGQSLKPSHIYVIQNGDHIPGTSDIVDEFKREYADLPIDVVESSANTRYHGRFFLAYALSSAEFVAVWDDDIEPDPRWLEFCVEYSKKHKFALVGGNGRNFGRQEPDGRVIQGPGTGRVDYVGHSWTLKRSLLRYYLGSEVYTFATGEDIQLSFALQRHGIESWTPEDGSPRAKDTVFTKDEHASWSKTGKTDPAGFPRQWLFCKVLKEGFNPLNCTNCSPSLVDKCLESFSILS